MQPHDVILTEYSADMRGFKRGADYYDKRLSAQERLTNDRLNRIDKRWERSSRSILNARTALGGLGLYIVGRGLSELRNYAEGWRNVERRLQSIGETSKEAQSGLVDLAIRTRSTVGGTAEAVQRMSKSTGANLAVTTRRVETLQKLLAAGGASGSERASVSLQLGQALKSGKLSGDEFRSISENAPIEFLDALAKAAGITRKELKGFAQDQKLSTDIVLQALDSLAGVADAKFGALAISGEEAFDVLTTGLTAYVGNIDAALGATASINGAMAHLGEYMAGTSDGAQTMARAIKVIGTVSLAVAGSRGVGALSGAFQKAAAAREKDVAATKKSIDASRELLIQRRLEKNASDERLRQAKAEIAARSAEGTVRKRDREELRIATKKQEKAVNRLAAAHQKAAVAAKVHTQAQKRLSLATRVSTAVMKSFNGVMAFFGGPIGAAITAITLFVSAMATMRTPAEKLESSLDRLSGTLSGLETVNGKLASDYSALKVAQEKLAEATEKGGEAAVIAATLEVNSIAKRIKANETYRKELASLAEVQLAEAKANLRAIEYEERKTARSRLAAQQLPDNYRGVGGDRAYLAQTYSTAEVDAFIEAQRELLVAAGKSGEALTKEQQVALENAKVHSEAALKVLDLDERVKILAADAPVLADGLDQAGETAKKLAVAATEAQAGIAGLIAAIPELNRASKLQAALAKAQSDRDKALSGLGDRSQWGPGEFRRASEINQLYERAAREIDGTAKAARDASRALDEYLDSARLGALDARGQALAREEAQYKQIVASLKEAGAAQAKIEQATLAHEQRRAQIEKQYSGKGRGGGGGSRSVARDENNLSAARALLVENGFKELYVEQELNREREKLRALLPDLIEMGLSRADAEAVIGAELERTRERLADVRTASEEASRAFAKNVLQDIRHAESLNDAIGSISDRLMDLAFDRAFDLLADQFAKLAAAGEGGGILSSIVSSLFGGGSSGGVSVKKAGGGLVLGAGTGTSDSIPARLSNGEFVVRAASVTPETLPFLNAINRGAVVPKFAGGGLVGGGASSAGGGAAMFDIKIFNNSSSAAVSAQKSPDGRSAHVFIEDVVRNGIMGGRFDGSLGSSFGIKRKPRGA